jgi:dTMP kinase
MTHWISLEGVNGVGKTHLARRLAEHLGPDSLLLDELTDAADTTAEVIVDALAAANGTFLRTGHPLTETFALAALKVREHEKVRSLPQPPAVVLEDRGVDTVAVYQAVILAGPDADMRRAAHLADRVAAIPAPWRPPADLVILLRDDLPACIARFEARTGKPVSAADRQLLAQVDDLYASRAAAQPARWRVCTVTGRTDTEILDEIHNWCRGLVAPAAPGGR